MARLVPGRKACSDASTHRQSRVRRTPAAENRSGSTDWRNRPPPPATHTAPGPSHLSLVTSAHSGFLSFCTYDIFEDVDSSRHVRPEHQAARCPLRGVRGDVCSGGGCRWRPGRPPPPPTPPSRPPVSLLPLRPAASSSWPFGLLHQGGHLSRGSQWPQSLLPGAEDQGPGSRRPVHRVPAQLRLPGECGTRALPVGSTVPITDVADPCIYYDGFLAAGSKVS